jgi:hypothetical protein
MHLLVLISLLYSFCRSWTIEVYYLNLPPLSSLLSRSYFPSSSSPPTFYDYAPPCQLTSVPISQNADLLLIQEVGVERRGTIGAMNGNGLGLATTANEGDNDDRIENSGTKSTSLYIFFKRRQ